MWYTTSTQVAACFGMAGHLQTTVAALARLKCLHHYVHQETLATEPVYDLRYCKCTQWTTTTPSSMAPMVETPWCSGLGNIPLPGKAVQLPKTPRHEGFKGNWGVWGDRTQNALIEHFAINQLHLYSAEVYSHLQSTRVGFVAVCNGEGGSKSHTRRPFDFYVKPQHQGIFGMSQILKHYLHLAVSVQKKLELSRWVWFLQNAMKSFNKN